MQALHSQRCFHRWQLLPSRLEHVQHQPLFLVGPAHLISLPPILHRSTTFKCKRRTVAVMVAWDTSKGLPVQLSTQELAERYSRVVEGGRNLVDFTKLQMTPDTAVELFECIRSLHREGTLTPTGSIHINLAENRVGTINIAQLSTIFEVMEECNWLCVHFGYDVVLSNLSSAMAEHVGLDCGRVTVDRPWEHPSNMIIASTLASIAETQKLLADSSTAAMKKLSGVAASYEGHIKTTSDALEHEMSKGIANFLQDGHVIASNYKYARVIEQTTGDLDCLVEGKLPDLGEVVVIGEVKTNIPKKCAEAILQVEANVKRWELLCDFIPPGDPTDQDEKAMAIDYKELQVERLRDRPIVRAVGGALFPPEMDAFFNKKMGNKKWLRVVLDGAVAKVVARQ